MTRKRILASTLFLLAILVAGVVGGGNSRAASTTSQPMQPGSQSSVASPACDCPQIAPVATSAHPVQGPLSGELTYDSLRGILSNRDLQYNGDWDRGDLAMAHDFDPDRKIGLWNKPQPVKVQEEDEVHFKEGGTPFAILRSGPTTINLRTAGRDDTPYGTDLNNGQLETGLLLNIARANKYGEVEGDMRENSLRVSWFLAGDLPRAAYAALTDQEKAGQRVATAHPASYPVNGYAATVTQTPMPAPAPASAPRAASSLSAPSGAHITIPSISRVPLQPALKLTPQIHAGTIGKLPTFDKAAKTITVPADTASRAMRIWARGAAARSAIDSALAGGYGYYDRPQNQRAPTGPLALDPFDLANAALDVIVFAPSQANNSFLDYRWTEPWHGLDDENNSELRAGYDKELVPSLLRLASMRQSFGGHAATGSAADAVACKAFAILVQLAAIGAPDGSHFRVRIATELQRSIIIVADKDWHGATPYARAARGALLVAGIADADEAQRLFAKLEVSLNQLGRYAEPHSQFTTAGDQLRALDVTMRDLVAYSAGDGGAILGHDMDAWINGYLQERASASIAKAHSTDFLNAQIDTWQTSSTDNPGVTLVSRPKPAATASAAPAAAPKACPFQSCSAALMAEPAKAGPMPKGVARVLVQSADTPDNLAGTQFLGRDEAFNIFVSVPHDMATTANLSVTVTNKKGGGSMNVPLGMGSSTPTSVSYHTLKPVMLSNAGANGFFTNSLSTKDGDMLSFSAEGATFAVNAYGSEALATIARVRAALVELQNALNLEAAYGVGKSDAPAKKLKVIANALKILDQKPDEKLTVITKARIGEAYIQFLGTDPAGWQSNNCDQFHVYQHVIYNGPDPLFPGVTYGSCSEGGSVHAVIELENQRLTEVAFRHLVNITISGYHAYVEAGCIAQQAAMPNIPCAEQFWLLFSGTDLDGNPVDKTHQILNAAGMVVPFLLDGRGQGAKEQIEHLMFGDGAVQEANNIAKNTSSAANDAEAAIPIRMGRRSAIPRTPLDSNKIEIADEAVFVDYSTRSTVPGSQVVVPRGFKPGKTIYGTPKMPGSYLAQQADNTCTLTVAESIRRKAGLAIRTEQDTIGEAVVLGRRLKQEIYSADGGTNPHLLAAFMENEGLEAAFVGSATPRDIEDALNRREWVEIGIMSGVDSKTGKEYWHSVEVLKMAPDATGTVKVTYGDPWNGNIWEVDFCDFWDAVTNKGQTAAAATLVRKP